MESKWTANQLSHQIFTGLLETKVHGDFDQVRCNNKNNLPVIGIGNWSGSDADDILDILPAGHKYMDTMFSKFSDDEDLMEEFQSFLTSDEFLHVQKNTLARNCDYFVKRLTHKDRLTNPKSILYCGMWSPLGIGEVILLLKRLPSRVNKDDIDELHKYALEHVGELADNSKVITNLESRAETIYNYVASL